MTREVWKRFRDTRYFVSSQGRVRGIHGRILRPLVERKRGGYLSVIVCANGKQKRMKVSRMVCEAFKGPPPSSSHEADHRDKKRANNWARNLRWLISSRNRALRDIARGERSGNTKITSRIVLAIRASGRSSAAMAKKYGLSQRHVNQIRNRKRWRHI